MANLIAEVKCLNQSVMLTVLFNTTLHFRNIIINNVFILLENIHILLGNSFPSFCHNLHLAIRKGLSRVFSWSRYMYIHILQLTQRRYSFLSILLYYLGCATVVYLHILYSVKVRHYSELQCSAVTALGLSINSYSMQYMYCYYSY